MHYETSVYWSSEEEEITLDCVMLTVFSRSRGHLGLILKGSFGKTD